jgi:hypothetical protein
MEQKLTLLGANIQRINWLLPIAKARGFKSPLI